MDFPSSLLRFMGRGIHKTVFSISLRPRLLTTEKTRYNDPQHNDIRNITMYITRTLNFCMRINDIPVITISLIYNNFLKAIVISKNLASLSTPFIFHQSAMSNPANLSVPISPLKKKHRRAITDTKKK
jgi:hypothetical protein